MKNLEKRVPVIRFKGFSEAWEQRKLEELAAFSKGSGYTKNDLVEKGIPLVLYGRLYTKYETIITEVNTFTKMKDKSVVSKGNEVVVPSSGETAKDISRASVIGAEGFILGGDLNIIQPKRELNSIFLALTISNGEQQKEIIKRAQGKSVVHVYNTDLKQVKLSYPIFNEQQKIGDFFKQLANTIALHQRKLEALKLMKKAFLQQIFPNNEEKVPRVRFVDFDEEWDQRKLGDLGSVVMNRRIFKEETSYKGEIPFYKIGTFGGVANSYITRERFEDYKLKYPYPEKGDVLISASGSIGRVVEYNGEEAYYQDSNIVWLKHDKQLNNLFLKQFYSIVKWSGIEGTTIKRLYNKNILQTEIKVPGIDEQKRIGIFFKQLDNNITRYQSKLEKLSSLKKAYLQRMFI
ncbi:restriction endonuclease subunit S [Listeria welshimeri]|nr:restriction endonuclease subunit S [Listeria welshimeri]